MPYHISPRNGAIRACEADTRPCPYGAEYHAATKEATQATKADLLANRKPLPRGSIDKQLRPQGASVSGFMGMFETYDEVSGTDTAYLHQMGVFPEELGNMVRKLIKSTHFTRGQNPNLFTEIQQHVLPDVTVTVTNSSYLGSQECPWQKHNHYKDTACNKATSGATITITSPRGTIRTNELMAHLIEHHKFFQGKHSDYRIDPARLLHVLGWH